MPRSLKGARIDAKLTREQVIVLLADKGVDISKNTLANYENGKTIPDVIVAKALVALYGCSIDDIRFSCN